MIRFTFLLRTTLEAKCSFAPVCVVCKPVELMVTKEATTAEQLMQTLFKKVKVMHNKDLNPNDYIFKISGHDEYLESNVVICSVVFVRECLKRSKKISLSLVKKVKAEYYNFSLEQDVKVVLASQVGNLTCLF